MKPMLFHCKLSRGSQFNLELLQKDRLANFQDGCTLLFTVGSVYHAKETFLHGCCSNLKQFLRWFLDRAAAYFCGRAKPSISHKYD